MLYTETNILCQLKFKELENFNQSINQSIALENHYSTPFGKNIKDNLCHCNCFLGLINKLKLSSKESKIVALN